MAGGNLLSDAALEQVRQVVRQVTGDTRGNRAPRQQPMPPGPECFFALTPEGGIAAVTGSYPGSAVCPLYKLDRVSGALSAITNASSDAIERTVYNPSSTAVGGDEFVPIHRTKLGAWTTHATGSGTTQAMVGHRLRGGRIYDLTGDLDSVDTDHANTLYVRFAAENTEGATLVTNDTTPSVGSPFCTLNAGGVYAIDVHWYAQIYQLGYSGTHHGLTSAGVQLLYRGTGGGSWTTANEYLGGTTDGITPVSVSGAYVPAVRGSFSTVREFDTDDEFLMYFVFGEIYGGVQTLTTNDAGVEVMITFSTVQ